MNKKVFFGLFISFSAFYLWQTHQVSQKANQNIENKNTQTHLQSKTTNNNLKIIDQIQSTQSKNISLELKEIKISNGLLTVSNRFNSIENWTLDNYIESKANELNENSKINIEKVTYSRPQDQVVLAFDAADFLYLNDVIGQLNQNNNSFIWNYSDENIIISKSIEPQGELPVLNLKYQIQFLKQNRPNTAYLSLRSGLTEDHNEKIDQQIAYYSNKEFIRNQADDLGFSKEKSSKKISSPVSWVASLSRYFSLVLLTDNSAETEGFVRPLSATSGLVSLAFPVRGSELNFSTRLYFGAKKLETLRKIEPSLDNTVDFGWFTFVAYPLLQIMRFFNQFLSNYGLAIILLTLLLKVCTYPLTYKSMKSMGQMAKLQPQLQKIREKYKDNKEALNRETLSLMRSQGYNPLAGCLPIIIQMPIFFALYRVLYSSVELYQAPFFLWIQDLSEKDPYFITPVLLSLTMFIQQKITPTTATDPMQQKMIQFMPLIFGAFMLSLPAGLTLYMLTNAVAGIFQQRILNKKLGLYQKSNHVAKA